MVMKTPKKTLSTRKIKAPKPLEKDIHKAIVQLLNRAMPKHVIWFHVPNGEKRTAVTASLLKAMGTMPGVPDLLLYDTHTGVLHCIEVKRPGEHLSDAQRSFMMRFTASPNGRYAVARSLDDAISIIQDWWGREVRVGMAGTILPGGAFIPVEPPMEGEDGPQD